MIRPDLALATHAVSAIREPALLDLAIDAYLDHLLAKGSKPGTVSVANYILRKVWREIGSTVWDPDAWERLSAERSRRLRPSTLRRNQIVVEQFIDFLSDSRYPWREQFKLAYGQYPARPVLDVNRQPHVEQFETEGRVRAATWAECRTFFGYLDARARTASSKRERRIALREGCESKLRLAYGLRNIEVAGARLSAFAPAPDVKIFGDFGSIRVIGKSKRLGPRRPRTVHTIGYFGFIVKVLQHYVSTVMPLFPNGDPDLLFRHDNGDPIDANYMSERFSLNRTNAGLPKQFTAHSLRRLYATTLAITGMPFHVISDQLGHEAAESTNGYTLIPDDYLERQLRIWQRRLLEP